MWKRRLVAATFLPALDDGDLLYILHFFMRFISNCKAFIHIQSNTGTSSLSYLYSECTERRWLLLRLFAGLLDAFCSVCLKWIRSKGFCPFCTSGKRFISVDAFNSRLKRLETNSTICTCSYNLMCFSLKSFAILTPFILLNVGHKTSNWTSFIYNVIL